LSIVVNARDPAAGASLPVKAVEEPQLANDFLEGLRFEAGGAGFVPPSLGVHRLSFGAQGAIRCCLSRPVERPDGVALECEALFVLEHFSLIGGGCKWVTAVTFPAASKQEVPVGSQISVDAETRAALPGGG
jgi:hypothetical protein